MSYNFSGVIVSCASGGVPLFASGINIPCNRVGIVFTGSGRVFIGNAPVGSGSTDLQRVGFPIYPTFSTASISGGIQNVTPNIQYVVVTNPSLLYASAENSGQIVFVNLETVFYHE